MSATKKQQQTKTTNKINKRKEKGDQNYEKNNENKIH